MRPSLLSVSAPRSRRRRAGTPAAGVSLHIDRIALQGFSRAEAHGIREALTHELQRALVRSPGLSQLEPGTRIAKENLTHQQSGSQSGRAARSGGAVARAVVDSIHAAAGAAPLQHGKDGR